MPVLRIDYTKHRPMLLEFPPYSPLSQRGELKGLLLRRGNRREDAPFLKKVETMTGEPRDCRRVILPL